MSRFVNLSIDPKAGLFCSLAFAWMLCECWVTFKLRSSVFVGLACCTVQFFFLLTNEYSFSLRACQ